MSINFLIKPSVITQVWCLRGPVLSSFTGTVPRDDLQHIEPRAIRKNVFYSQQRNTNVCKMNKLQ